MPEFSTDLLLGGFEPALGRFFPICFLGMPFRPQRITHNLVAKRGGSVDVFAVPQTTLQQGCDEIVLMIAGEWPLSGADCQNYQSELVGGSHGSLSATRLIGVSCKFEGAKGGGTYTSENLTDTLAGGKYKGTIELP
jgi:hypothetical protein